MSGQRVELEVVVRPSDQEVGSKETRGRFWLSAGKAVVIGRSLQDADLPINDDPSLSKRHFSVAFDGQRCRLVDLASKNGTIVNGNRVGSVDLHHGDVVCAGQTVFRVNVVKDAIEPTDEKKEETTILSAERCEPSPASPVESQSAEVPPASAEVPPVPAESLEDDGPYLFLTLTVIETPSVSSDDLRASRMMAWIRAGQTVIVGRAPWESDWTFRGDDRMSGKHFSVTCDGRKCYVSDLDSANGTLLNRVAITHAELCEGDRILAGQTEFAAQIMGRE
ncbi:MAG: FHA domain-containing protein [Pirellulaceae bacterium]|nr:FHA domain-containing protein [Pirellulaceae bacterium]